MPVYRRGKRRYQKLARWFVKALLSSQSIPWLAAVSVLATGIALSYSILNEPTIAIIAIAAGTFVLAISVLLISYLTIDDRANLSSFVPQQFYSYEVLESKIVWDLEDPSGEIATMKKERLLRFTRTGVKIIREYVWGDEYSDIAIPPEVDFTVTPGVVRKIYREGGKFVVPVELDRSYRRGERLKYRYERKLHGAFTANEEWVELQTVTNTKNEEIIILFPKNRPPKTAIASFRWGDYSDPIELGEGGFRLTKRQGRPALIWRIEEPKPRCSYLIRWEW